MHREIIQQGAEAILYREGNELVKDRVSKGYRIPELDAKIRKLRTRGEARMLDTAARAGLSVPRVLESSGNIIRMEFIEGARVKDALNGMDEAESEKVWTMIGEAVARLHSAGIMHGDLTTSNMILTGKGSDFKLYIIDFGLSKLSNRVEDLAVDLYLLYEAFKAAHFKYLNRSWQYILKSYDANYNGAQAVIQRFKVIEKRRRYKTE